MVAVIIAVVAFIVTRVGNIVAGVAFAGVAVVAADDAVSSWVAVAGTRLEDVSL